MDSANNLQRADYAYTTAVEQLQLLLFCCYFARKTLSELSFWNPFTCVFCETDKTALLLCLSPCFENNFPTVKEISLFKTQIDHNSVNSGALKKSFHTLLITTGHSVVIICMHNRLPLFTDTVKKTNKEVNKRWKQISNLYLIHKHEFKSHGLCIT